VSLFLELEEQLALFGENHFYVSLAWQRRVSPEESQAEGLRHGRTPFPLVTGAAAPNDSLARQMTEDRPIFVFIDV